MSTSDIHVVVQDVNGKLIVPIQDPVYDRQLEEVGAVLLARLQAKSASAVVLDLSSVEVLDAHDFEQLRRLSDALMLMGAPMLLAGIRPGVAAGLVMLDVEDGWVRSSLSVERALATVT